MEKYVKISRVQLVFALLTILFVIAGCAAKGESGSESAKAVAAGSGTEAESTEVSTVENDEVAVDDAGGHSAATDNSEISAAESPDDVEETAAGVEEITTAGIPAPVEKAALPLYKKLCGKYSAEIDGEYEVLEITEFGGNLYAFGGNAIGEPESEELELYSFWAMEIFPENKADLFSTDSDELKAGIMSFSIMSNFGKYWNPPSAGTIRWTEEGIRFEDFDSSFPFSGGTSARPFTPDERVADTFPYMDPHAAVPESVLMGFWKETDSGVPVYLEFAEDGNVRIYRKDIENEVLFGCGGYQFSGESEIEGMMNLLGSGAMPIAFTVGLKQDGDTLTIDTGNDAGELAEVFFDGAQVARFERTRADEIPVITLSDVKEAGFDENRSYNAWEDADHEEAK